MFKMYFISLIIFYSFSSNASHIDNKRKAEHIIKEPKAKKQRKYKDVFSSHMYFISTSDAGDFAVQHGEAGLLGVGKQGKVFKAQNLASGEWVAAKIQDYEFDDFEILGCERAGQLVAEPQVYINQRGEKQFVYLQKLINGINLWRWLKNSDPDKNLSLDYFMALRKKLYVVLNNKIHNRLMVFNDCNLKNIIIEISANKVRFIDFGNVVLFGDQDESSSNFKQYREQDYIMIDAALFLYLSDNKYPQELQDIFWSHMFLKAYKIVKKYHSSSSDLFGHEYAAQILYRLTDGGIPGFLSDYYKHEDFAEEIKRFDDLIAERIKAEFNLY